MEAQARLAQDGCLQQSPRISVRYVTRAWAGRRRRRRYDRDDGPISAITLRLIEKAASASLPNGVLLYARMAAEDRELRLQGYEVYRFGAAEFTDVERNGRSRKVGLRSRDSPSAFSPDCSTSIRPRRVISPHSQGNGPRAAALSASRREMHAQWLRCRLCSSFEMSVGQALAANWPITYEKTAMVDLIWGTAKDKPEASKALAEQISAMPDLKGYLYIGYPVMGSPTGPVKFDALLVSEDVGLVAFDLVEGTDVSDYKDRQDGIASMLEVKLKPYAELKRGRSLKFDVNVVTFAPAKTSVPSSEGEYFVSNLQNFANTLGEFSWDEGDETFKKLLAAIQVVTSIRAGKAKREPRKADSRGARLKKIEDSIANLDQRQSQAVIETVEGVQRIRGLAGSGKTIILALKVAYLHAQNDDWRIAVTFNTRSLKDQFKRLINNFTIEQTGSEPDWDRVDILNAWGAPGSKERDGIYHKFCRAHSVDFLDYGTAKRKFGQGNEFQGACADALKAATDSHQFYDIILVDEAQDLPAEFLRLCYRFLKEPKRLVYAYDELQSLTGQSVQPPEELFGKNAGGEPLVKLNLEEGTSPRQDIILEKCYRNSRPLLATAHAIGFGIYREKGLVQFFEQDNLWTDVGYTVEAGELKGGERVTLARTPDTSPLFLEDHSPLADLIEFIRFDDAKSQADWLARQIQIDIEQEELRPDDIVVINPNPFTTEREVGPIRAALFAQNIDTELAGVSTSADVFFKADAVTFTGIFRAKGNEAGMVYIMNAQDCYAGWDKSATALVRNRLFTAITRSKAWVRVLGIGANMNALIAELNALRQNDFKLIFQYPTTEEKKDLRLINREMLGRRRIKQRRSIDEIMEAVAAGELDADQLAYALEKLSGKRPRRATK